MADPTPLPTTNAVASGVDTAIADGESAAETAVDTMAEAAQPWLALPVIKQIFQSIVSYICGLLGKTGQLLATFAITKYQGSVENSALQTAETEVEAAIQSGDPNAIAKAEQDFQKAQSAAVNSDGSAQPQ